MSLCAPVLGQEDAQERTVEDTAVTRTDARFTLTVLEPDRSAGDEAELDGSADDAAGSQLSTEPAGLSSGARRNAGSASAFSAEAMMLGEWTDTEPGTLEWTGANVVQRAAVPAPRGQRITVRSSGVFGLEASQLTPLSGGKEMFAFEVAEGLTLSGVGSRRLWTERDRAFVLAAEAGWRLSPQAGLHLGYEVLQTPLGGVLPEDAGGDSIFARFQLRF